MMTLRFREVKELSKMTQQISNRTKIETSFFPSRKYFFLFCSVTNLKLTKIKLKLWDYFIYLRVLCLSKS